LSAGSGLALHVEDHGLLRMAEKSGIVLEGIVSKRAAFGRERGRSVRGLRTRGNKTGANRPPASLALSRLRTEDIIEFTDRHLLDPKNGRERIQAYSRKPTSGRTSGFGADPNDRLRSWYDLQLCSSARPPSETDAELASPRRVRPMSAD
jgi:hypothetical protein